MKHRQRCLDVGVTGAARTARPPHPSRNHSPCSMTPRLAGTAATETRAGLITEASRSLEWGPPVGGAPRPTTHVNHRKPEGTALRLQQAGGGAPPPGNLSANKKPRHFQPPVSRNRLFTTTSPTSPLYSVKGSPPLFSWPLRVTMSRIIILHGSQINSFCWKNILFFV